MQARLPDTLTLIQSLLERPSISSTNPDLDQSNLEVIHLLAEWLEKLDFTIEIQPVSPDKANLIATLGNTQQRDGLVLSGHTDTVPLDEARWTLNPFAATERDNRIYGLGVTDMKSFFALALEAASSFKARDLHRPLVILATADEESSMSGAKMLRDSGRQLGRYAVIGEPTNLRPIRMHKGVMMESIQVHGQAGHSSDPSLGASALEGMHAVLSELLLWRSELQARHHNPLFKVAVPTVNLGSIHGGDNPNRICSHCETQIDIRPLPGMKLDELHDSLQQRLAPVLAEHPRLSLQVQPLFDGVPPFETDPDTEIVRFCESATQATADAVAFGTEAPYLSQLGMQTIVLGPGNIAQAHQADEYLALNQIKPTIQLLQQLIQHFCIDDLNETPSPAS